MAYNFAHDVALPRSAGAPVGFLSRRLPFMYALCLGRAYAHYRKFHCRGTFLWLHFYRSGPWAEP